MEKEIRKINLRDKQSDFHYWQQQPPCKRLEALEEIRAEYNSWKYATEQGFQRVYRITKRK
jgi:hypothetical protein